ncbi:glycerophosphodiester phosphodiesterase protein kinase domain-containing gdpdl2 [Phtheirospermum japonicum]|uniref:Glycerophosphodiester phosphodiesterase protein kinase domain-containing gdpdl2 n=1 Tax=Phtheirospermum japonicum TaxID=374723 RepID=A0A830BZ33_9LAMI|nr:glycerophosphodiester phosphodiesterase protein kinase domain-containing gdpdl2 [Phtheirospermum japonicum]
MSIFLVFIFFSLLFPAGLGGVETDDCKPTSCSKDGPTIQFPFRNKYLSPEYCGYNPGFDVFCNERNETVLILPLSVQVVVKKINYVDQQVEIYDPEKCLVKKLTHPDLSASSFHFLSEDLDDYVLFNCSGSKTDLDYFSIPCHDDTSSVFLAFLSDSRMMNYLPLTSCTKIRNIPSVPWDVFTENNLHLKWSEPACGWCEAKGKRCGLSNFTGEHQIIQCVDQPYMNNKKVFDKSSYSPGATLGSFVIILAAVLLYTSIRSSSENYMMIEKFLEDHRALKPIRFSYSDLRRITLKFSEKLGEGGYGTVYKGYLSNEINVAVKVLHNSKGNGEDFVNEVSTIGRIHHVNVVRLVGFCADGLRRALVYEFLPNDSLEKFIFQSSGSGSKKRSLGWQKLRDIALGIAKGIEYLHEGCDRQILHFDIKPHNILLDQNFNPKICDFSLAKLCVKEQNGVTMTAARGTMGYIAPEVLSRIFGRVSHKSDVYSFGMLLLEMVGGRKNIDTNYINTSQVYFPQWIYNHLDLSFEDDFWARIEEGEDGIIARRLTIVGLWCIQWCPSDRPSMKDAIQMLEGPEESLTIPPNPFPANNTNATNSVGGMIPGRRHYEIELPLIQESEYFSA